MTRNAIMTALLTAVIGGAATTALAFGPGSHRHGEWLDFDALDVDNSGEVTREEMAALAVSRFETADMNGDAVLNAEELAAAAARKAEARAVRMIERFDTDGDGALSLQEVPRLSGKRSGRIFDLIDSDDSGGISRAEFAEMQAEMHKQQKLRWHKN